MQSGRTEYQTREAGDRYRRVIDRSNKKVKGVALVVCREINMIDKIEIGE